MVECKNTYHLSELLQKFGHRNIKKSQENFQVEDPWGCGQIDSNYGSQTLTFSDYPDAKTQASDLQLTTRCPCVRLRLRNL